VTARSTLLIGAIASVALTTVQAQPEDIATSGPELSSPRLTATASSAAIEQIFDAVRLRMAQTPPNLPPPPPPGGHPCHCGGPYARKPPKTPMRKTHHANAASISPTVPSAMRAFQMFKDV
jgi:hypothetical protein